ncbi:uncharacterized protein KZ484_021555 [Pholidichthys leucotaenia]
MEENIIAALCLLCFIGLLVLADLEITCVHLENVVRRARRRRDMRRNLVRLVALQLTAQTHREAQDHRRRRRLLLRRIAQRSSPSVWVRKRSDDWWKSVVPCFNSDQWLQNFRMSRETFQYVCGRLRTAMEKRDTNYRLSVPLEKRVAVALWKLATNAEYSRIAHQFGVGISTAFKCLKEFCSSVEEVLLPEFIQMPSAEKLREMALHFEQWWGLPQCVGAIGRSHIPIMAPQEDHIKYCNQEGWCSVVLQAAVDGGGLFWDVHAGKPGSMDDVRVLRSSLLWEQAERGAVFSQRPKTIDGQDVGYYFIGDAAYPLTGWLMKSYLDDGCLTKEQQVFNYKISQARVVVEDTFCRLKGRWRCLQKRNDCSLQRVKSIVLSCCVLHNLCEGRGEEYREEWGTPLLNPQPDVHLPSSAQTEGVKVRAALTRFLNSADSS